jgi:hypothetical protein
MPGDTAGTGGRLLVIGANHRTIQPTWRERCRPGDAAEAEALTRRVFRLGRDEGKEAS